MGEIIPFSAYLCDAQADENGALLVGCMDDRYPSQDDTVLGDQLYYQLPGGIYALGIDTAIAMETEQPGCFAKLGHPVHVIASTAGKILSGAGFGGAIHKECAAFEGAYAISTTVAQPSLAERPGNFTGHGLVYERSAAILPGLDSTMYWRITEATDRVRGAIAPTSTATAHLEKRNIPKATLVAEAHTAKAFLVSHDPNVMFRVKDARVAGNPAYFTNLGILEVMLPELTDVFPAKIDTLKAATAVRLGSISTEHLLDAQNQVLPILQVA